MNLQIKKNILVLSHGQLKVQWTQLCPPDVLDFLRLFLDPSLKYKR